MAMSAEPVYRSPCIGASWMQRNHWWIILGRPQSPCGEDDLH